MKHTGPEVLVLGAAGIVRDLVEHVIANDPEFGGNTGEHTVAVLVDPSDRDWVTAGARTLPVVLLTREVRPATLVAAVRQGAEAVLDAETSTDHLLRAIRAVSAGGSHFDARQTHILTAALRSSEGPVNQRISLTGREREILASIRRGDLVKQTAHRLGVSPKTVENLQSRLFRKLAVRNRAQAIAAADDAGLLEDDASVAS